MAKAMINAIMSPPPDTGQGDYLEIPRSAVGRIIGAGGARIQELQDRSGAKIDIDRQPDRVLVRFAGLAENVQLAKTLVTEVLEGGSGLQKRLTRCGEMHEHRCPDPRKHGEGRYG